MFSYIFRCETLYFNLVTTEKISFLYYESSKSSLEYKKLLYFIFPTEEEMLI